MKNKNLKKKRRVPELRFPEFSGEWEEKRLGEISTHSAYGMNAAAKPFDGENKYIRITDIDDETNQYKQDDLVSPNAQLSDKYLLSEGDILFARTGASVGKTYYYKKDDGKVYYAGYLIKFNIKDGYDYRFVFYNTLTDRYKNWVKIMSMRSGQPGINSKEYSRWSINIPLLSEQEKIGNFFYTIDKKLELQQEKIDILKEYKKGMMQKIFSQEIRFKDDDGKDFPDWKEKRIMDLGSVMTGRTPSTKKREYWDGTIPFITPTDIKSKYTLRTERHLTEKGLEKGIIVPENSLLITCIASIGKNTINKKISSCNQQINFINVNDRNSVEFLYYKLSHAKNKILSFAGQTATRIVNKTEFEAIKLQIPSLLEQKKIANFLSAIDKKIELEEEKLENMKKFKKGLMQRMFV